MLGLSRKPGESIRIGDHITVTIARVFGNRVRVLIDAPHDVRILRTEIIDRHTNTTENDQK